MESSAKLYCGEVRQVGMVYSHRVSLGLHTNDTVNVTVNLTLNYIVYLYSHVNIVMHTGNALKSILSAMQDKPLCSLIYSLSSPS